MLRLPCAFPFLSSQFSDPAIVASAFKSVVEEIKNLKISPPADDSRCVHCRKRRCVATYPACARNSYANERRQAVDEPNVPVPAPPFPGVPLHTSLCSLAHRMNPAPALFDTLSYPPETTPLLTRSTSHSTLTPFPFQQQQHPRPRQRPGRQRPVRSSGRAAEPAGEKVGAG